MSFTVARNHEQAPSYPMLCRVSEEHHICIAGDRRTGSFSCRGVDGDYQFSENGIKGKFSGHGVKGEFCFGTGNVVVTVIEKPFWLPESFLKRKIAEGLDTLGNDLARQQAPEKDI